VVLRVGDRGVNGSGELVRTVASLAPGSRVDFAVMRDGKKIDLAVRLNSRADDDKIAAGKLWPGFAVAEPEAGKVVVAAVDQGSKADSLLQQGDLVLKINGSSVGSVREFYRLLGAADQRRVLLDLQRDGDEIVVGINH